MEDRKTSPKNSNETFIKDEYLESISSTRDDKNKESHVFFFGCFIFIQKITIESTQNTNGSETCPILKDIVLDLYSQHYRGLGTSFSLHFLG